MSSKEKRSGGSATYENAVAAPGSAPRYVFDLGGNDVLLGRGAPNFQAEGNKRFRSYIQTRKDEYKATTSNYVKDKIAREVIHEIARRNGRFLRRIGTGNIVEGMDLAPDTKVWEIADEMIAIEKIKQALRGKDRQSTGLRQIGISRDGSGSISRSEGISCGIPDSEHQQTEQDLFESTSSWPNLRQRGQAVPPSLQQSGGNDPIASLMLLQQHQQQQHQQQSQIDWHHQQMALLARQSILTQQSPLWHLWRQQQLGPLGGAMRSASLPSRLNLIQPLSEHAHASTQQTYEQFLASLYPAEANQRWGEGFLALNHPTHGNTNTRNQPGGIIPTTGTGLLDPDRILASVYPNDRGLVRGTNPETASFLSPPLFLNPNSSAMSSFLASVNDERAMAANPYLSGYSDDSMLDTTRASATTAPALARLSSIDNLWNLSAFPHGTNLGYSEHRDEGKREAEDRDSEDSSGESSRGEEKKPRAKKPRRTSSK